MAWKLSMSRLASISRIGAAIAIAAAAVFCSLELAGNPSGPFRNPAKLRAKQHTLSFTLRAGITSDGRNSFYFDGISWRSPKTAKQSPNLRGWTQ